MWFNTGREPFPCQGYLKLWRHRGYQKLLLLSPYWVLVECISSAAPNRWGWQGTGHSERGIHSSILARPHFRQPLNQGDCVVCPVTAHRYGLEGWAQVRSQGTGPSSFTDCVALALKPVSPCTTPGSWLKKDLGQQAGKMLERPLVRLYGGKGGL